MCQRHRIMKDIALGMLLAFMSVVCIVAASVLGFLIYELPKVVSGG